MARKILIVDDDVRVREALHLFLETEGHEVIQAEGGERAIALANTFQIDAFVIDVGMPRMNGIDLCRAIRGMERYRRTPIVFLTGENDDAILEEAFTSGGDDFVNKPCMPAALRARLTSHLQRTEYLQRLERM